MNSAECSGSGSGAGTGSLLSAAGDARRRTLRGELMGRVRWRGHRRRALHAALLTFVVALGLRVLSPLAPMGTPRGSGANAVDVVVAPSTRIVRDDPTVLARCRATGSERVERIDDASLQAALGASGRRTGFVRCGSRVTVTAPVDDWSGAGGQP
jgi:hypothetical protein